MKYTVVWRAFSKTLASSNWKNGEQPSGSFEMTQVTVDADMLRKLNGLNGPLEFCDEQGHVLGRFEPSAADDLEPGIPRDELRRRAENFQGRPLSDLLTEWEKRK